MVGEDLIENDGKATSGDASVLRGTEEKWKAFSSQRLDCKKKKIFLCLSLQPRDGSFFSNDSLFL